MVSSVVTLSDSRTKKSDSWTSNETAALLKAAANWTSATPPKKREGGLWRDGPIPTYLGRTLTGTSNTCVSNRCVKIATKRKMTDSQWISNTHGLTHGMALGSHGCMVKIVPTPLICKSSHLLASIQAAAFYSSGKELLKAQRCAVYLPSYQSGLRRTQVSTSLNIRRTPRPCNLLGATRFSAAIRLPTAALTK